MFTAEERVASVGIKLEGIVHPRGRSGRLVIRIRSFTMRPTLFILKPSFADPKVGAGVFFCPHSATIEGLLSFYPELRTRLDVRYVEFPRPRHEVIAEIGEANQACPVLVLPKGWDTPVSAGRIASGRSFFVGATEIATFLAQWAKIGLPHP